MSQWKVTINFDNEILCEKQVREEEEEEEEEEGGSFVSGRRSIALPWKPLQVPTVQFNTTVGTYQCDCPKMQIG